MKILIFALVCLSVASAYETSDSHWELFKSTYKKVYASKEEELVKKSIWKRNLQFIQNHNIRADLGLYSFWLGVNEFADVTFKEHARLRNGYRMAQKKTFNYQTHFDGSPLASSVDWRTSGCVTPVKNQEQCGSCWAFSATGSLEGQMCLKSGNKTLVSLSEQNLVDCSKKEGNHGCEGGLMDDAFQYVIDNKGLDTEKCYKYDGRDEKCQYKKNQTCSVGHCKGFVDVKSQSETDLQAAVAKVGPVSVAIDASSIFFQLYRHGVYNSWWCSKKNLDHGVLVVGYGVESGKDYWLVKNSWGSSWGEAGYIKMSRNKNNQCGIATQASYPTV